MLYFWTNAGYQRHPSSQNIYEIPVVCSKGEKVTPQRLDVEEIKEFLMYGIVPLPSGAGFVAIELDVPNGRVVFHLLERGQQAEKFALIAHARPPGYLKVSSGSTYDLAGVDQVYFLSGERFVALNLHGWGFYVLDLRNRKFVLGGALNRVNVLSAPIGGAAALATTLSGP